jgi:hypothetical protein
VATIDLEAAIQSKVAAAVAELNGDLEAMIAAAIDRELDKLVAAAVAERTNGDAAAKASPPKVGAAAKAPTVKTCRVCGRAKPLADFDKHRATCRPCRTERRHQGARNARTVVQPDQQQAAPAPLASAGSNGPA